MSFKQKLRELVYLLNLMWAYTFVFFSKVVATSEIYKSRNILVRLTNAFSEAPGWPSR